MEYKCLFILVYQGLMESASLLWAVNIIRRNRQKASCLVDSDWRPTAYLPLWTRLRVTSGVFDPIWGHTFQVKRWSRPTLPFLSRRGCRRAKSRLLPVIQVRLWGQAGQPRLDRNRSNSDDHIPAAKGGKEGVHGVARRWGKRVGPAAERHRAVPRSVTTQVPFSGDFGLTGTSLR